MDQACQQALRLLLSGEVTHPEPHTGVPLMDCPPQRVSARPIMEGIRMAQQSELRGARLWHTLSAHAETTDLLDTPLPCQLRWLAAVSRALASAAGLLPLVCSAGAGLLASSGALAKTEWGTAGAVVMPAGFPSCRVKQHQGEWQAQHPGGGMNAPTRSSASFAVCMALEARGWIASSAPWRENKCAHQ